MKSEIWKKIKDFGGLYEVSSLGRIRSWKAHRGYGTLKKPKILAQSKTPNGYMVISLYKDKIRYRKSVHRLVIETFLGKENLTCNHMNGKKDDNRLENLEYATFSENINHAFKNNLIPVGEKHHHSKLTEKQVLEIRGSLLKVSELAEKYKVNKSTIRKILNRKNWTHI